ATFINFFPVPDEDPKSGFYQNHFVPAHTFGQIQVEDGRARLGMLDAGFVNRESGWLHLGPSPWPGKMVTLLTAPTSELKVFARDLAKDAHAFNLRITLVR